VCVWGGGVLLTNTLHVSVYQSRHTFQLPSAVVFILLSIWIKTVHGRPSVVLQVQTLLCCAFNNMCFSFQKCLCLPDNVDQIPLATTGTVGLCRHALYAVFHTYDEHRLSRSFFC
jgi:hypothetical protein